LHLYIQKEKIKKKKKTVQSSNPEETIERDEIIALRINLSWYAGLATMDPAAES
jgi:hypothetical protein